MRVTRFHRLAALTGLLAGLMGQPAVADPTPLVADFTDAAYFLSGDFNNIGWSFSVTSNVTIDGLGLFDYQADGLINSHQVGLWNSAGTLIAQTVVFTGATPYASASNAGQWLVVDIAALTLTVGDYVIGAFYSDNDDDPIAAIATGFDLDSHFTYVDSRASDGTAFAMPGVYGQVEPGIFGPNMRVATVPEPGHLLLLPLALAAAAAARRRRR